MIIDMQHDYCVKDGKAYAPEYEAVIEPIRTLIATARIKNMPIMYTQNWISDKDGLWAKAYEQGLAVVPPHCLEGTRGAEIIDEIKPLATDYVIKKTSFNMLLGSYRHSAEKTLEKFRSKSPSVDTFIVVGADMNVCVFLNSDALHSFGYSIVLPEDCIGGSPIFGAINGLFFLSMLDAARITTTELMKLE